MKIKNLTNIEK